MSVKKLIFFYRRVLNGKSNKQFVCLSGVLSRDNQTFNGMNKEKIKKEIFKATPEGAVLKPHNFEGEYEKSDEYLVKNEEGEYKVIERSALVHGTLKDLDEKDNYEAGKNKSTEENEELCNFVCGNCDKLKKGQCREEYVECDTCDGKMAAVYYRKTTKKGDVVFRKPFSVKKKE